MLVIVVVSGIRQNNQAKEQTSQDLASLENKDAGYIVKYPTNFDVIYTQNGVEFTPKQSPGKITLDIVDGIAKVNIQTEGANQSQLSMLNSTAQTIKDTFQFTKQTPVDKTNTDKRFENINFDPNKY